MNDEEGVLIQPTSSNQTPGDSNIGLLVDSRLKTRESYETEMDGHNRSTSMHEANLPS